MDYRESAIAKLQQLSEPSLEKANQLLDLLLLEENCKQLSTQSEEMLKRKWEKWFSQVDQLEVSPNPPQDDYLEGVTNTLIEWNSEADQVAYGDL